jgi:hypothetical protein
MYSFNSFKIYFIPKDKNKKNDSLLVVVSLFHPDNCKNHNTFHLKIIFSHLVLENEHYLQFFENDEKLFGFLVDSDNASKIPND